MLKLVMESNGFPSFDNQSHGWVLTASSHIEITGNGSPYEIIWYAVTLNKDPISTLTNYNSPLILRNLTVIPLSLDQMTQNASLNTSIPLDDETNTVAIVGDYLGDDQVPDRQPSFCDFLSPIKPTDPWTWPLEFENMSDPQGLQLPQLDAANLSDIADYVVRKHNCLRTKVTPSAANMLRMEWNQEAADQAQLWANQCHYGHSNETGRTTSSKYHRHDNNEDVIMMKLPHHTDAQEVMLRFLLAWYNKFQHTFATNIPETAQSDALTPLNETPVFGKPFCIR